MILISILELTYEDAKSYFLKSTSYSDYDLPSYIDFSEILKSVDVFLSGKKLNDVGGKKARNYASVNYKFIGNKDGKLGWRPYELIHPAIYVELVNTVCSAENWPEIQSRFSRFGKSCVECCSIPMVSKDEEADKATQVRSWWQRIEQKSLCLSLEYDHLLHTDVTDCYPSIYTHSIPWALHGKEAAKANRTQPNLGNSIDRLIQDGRYGQTNGLPQGATLMHLIAEIVLGYVDEQVSAELKNEGDFHILRYRDDYRIFSNSDQQLECIVQVVSDKLRDVGLRLGAAKTIRAHNVVSGSIKPDKMAAMNLQDLGLSNAKTLQKQILRIQNFGLSYPNSGALKRLLSDFHIKIENLKKVEFDDVEVLVAIATDIASTSPQTIPVIMGILSYLIASIEKTQRKPLWEKVSKKLQRVPNNGYLEIWLQRVTISKDIDLDFQPSEPICRLIAGDDVKLWESDWISNLELKSILNPKNILQEKAEEGNEIIESKEIALFNNQLHSL